MDFSVHPIRVILKISTNKVPREVIKSIDFVIRSRIIVKSQLFVPSIS